MHNRTISLQTTYMIASEIQSSLTADLYIPARRLTPSDRKDINGLIVLFNRILDRLD